MDAKAVEMLAKGLQAHKRKRKAPHEGLKKARFDISSSVAPINAIAAPKVANGIKVAPTVEVGATDGVAVPPTSSSPPTEVQVLELSARGEKREKKKKKRMSIIVKVRHKAHPSESNDDNEDLEENLFYN
ncbi:hypothetical protein COCNU_scaffold005031G000050 [Cocos nucifera]|nr:hypothetical protein [Cocos nucifera]